MFYLTISQEAAAELTILEGWLLNLQRDPLLPDQWVWPSKSGSFSAKGFYTIMHSHMPTIMPCKWLWKSRCTMKIKVFGWLLFFDRLNTKDMLVRRHWRSQAEDNLCVICNAYVHEDSLICSSSAISAQECGTTSRLTGPRGLISRSVLPMPDQVLVKLFSLR